MAGGKKRKSRAKSSVSDAKSVMEEEVVMQPIDEEEDGENISNELACEDDDSGQFVAAMDDEAAKERVLARVALEEASGGEHRVAWDPRLRSTDEELECDSRAYAMYHRLGVEWPCLSFDVVTDEQGGGRTVFPHQLTIACGTQASQASENRLSLLRVSNLRLMEVDDSDDDDDRELDDDQDNDDLEPVVVQCGVPHPGTVNRVASWDAEPGMIATWSAESTVHVWDLRTPARSLERSDPAKQMKKGAVATLTHVDEGYALAWASDGRLATGDNSGHVAIWASGRFDTKDVSWQISTAAVEDIAWSPTETTVIMSVGCDASVRVWDTRAKAGPMLTRSHAHSSDINSMSWNVAVSYLVATAGDDGHLKIWDLRSFQASSDPVGRFSWHDGKPIVSCQWDPHDESVLVLAAADHTVTLWDLSVEDDAPSNHVQDDFAASVPPQLLFIHQGLHDPKEAKYHPQIPGLVATTAADGFSFFIPALEGRADNP